MNREHQPLIILAGRHKIIYCVACGVVRLRFGNLSLSYKERAFLALHDFLQTTVSAHFLNHPDRELQMRLGEVCLCLNEAESEALMSLVKDGWLLICRQRLEALYC